jgi:hypothetical protein
MGQSVTTTLCPTLGFVLIKIVCKNVIKDYTMSIIIQKEVKPMPTPESKVKDAVVKILKDYGVYYFFPATHGYGRSGVPDIICCYMGAFIAIECKTIKGKLTALQERELLRIRRAGGQSFVVNEDMLDDLKLYFASFDEEGRG